jgi:hypothetical protein
VLVYKAPPTGPPGFGDLQKRTTAFKNAHANSDFIINDNLSQLFANARFRRESLVDDSLDFVRRRYGNGYLYFIVNNATKPFTGYAPLASAFHSAAIFDPTTGEKGTARQKDRSVYLQLLPGQSCIVETDPAAQAPLFPYYQPSASPVALQGAWRLEFLSGGPELPPATTLNKLGSWTSTSSNFSGMAKYTLTFNKPNARAAAWLLDLGKVDRTAQVTLNGKDMGTLIGPDFRLTIPANAIQAQNTLEIMVSNGMVNRIEDLDRKGIHWKKFYNYNFPAHVPADRGPDGLFDAGKWKPMDSGLSGPVTLTPLKPI